MTQPGTARPSIDPREVRPSRGWYVVAAVIVVLGLATVPLFGFLGVGAFKSAAENSGISGPKTRLASDAPIVVNLTAEQPWAIYIVSGDAEGTDNASPSSITATRSADCTVTGTGGAQVGLEPTTTSMTFSWDGHEWQMIYTVTPSQNGQYEFRCRPTDDSALGADFVVAKKMNAGKVVAGAFGGVASVFGAILGPCTGLLIGGLIILIVALVRNSNRRRLERQRLGYPPAPLGGYPPR